jgi:hypothetical protein
MCNGREHADKGVSICTCPQGVSNINEGRGKCGPINMEWAGGTCISVCPQGRSRTCRMDSLGLFLFCSVSTDGAFRFTFATSSPN